ncbi:MAG TPA: rhodanese-like domain-containing protein [Gemmatimonadaceae bacterium]|nr:rhodanese-like domain-containing protein [Gemmatimonadaceae bacterium]
MPRSGTDLVNEAKQRITEIDPAEARARLAAGDAVFVDVREPNESNLGRIPGATILPRGTIEVRGEGVLPRGRRLIVYCAGGSRSALAADTLQTMGYEAVSLRGGYRGWVESGGAVEG